jgi:hypothetical protein
MMEKNVSATADLDGDDIDDFVDVDEFLSSMKQQRYPLAKGMHRSYGKVDYFSDLPYPHC